MSHLVLTAVFGRPNRYHPGPRTVRVLAQVLQGGSRVYLFNPLDDGSAAHSVRVRTDGLSTADALRAGFVITETALPLNGQAREVAERLRALPQEADVELATDDGLCLATAAAELRVSVLITLIGGGEDLGPEQFPGWELRTAELCNDRHYSGAL